jgi:hypothetical protein
VSIFIESRHKVTWRSKVEIDHMVWNILSHNLYESMPKQDQVWQPSWSQKEMKWQQSTLCKLKSKKCILYLLLSVVMPLNQEGHHMDRQQNLNTQHSLKTQVRWVKHNGHTHTHTTSHWTLENLMFWFPKLEHPVYVVIAIFQILDALVQNRMFQFLLVSSQRLVFGGQI